MDVGSPIPFQGTESFPYMLYVKQAVTSMLFWNFHVKSIGMGTPTMYSEGCLQKPWVYRHSWFTLCEFQVSRWCTAKVNLLTNIFLCKKDCSPRALSLHSRSSYCWRASKRCHTSPHPHPLIKALYMSKIQFSGIQKHFFFFFFFFLFFLGGRGVWPFLPFIRSGQNHLARHSERGKKTRQTEEEVERQHQGMDGPGVRQVPDCSGEQGKIEKTGCKIISGAPVTLAVKGQIMRWWWGLSESSSMYIFHTI